VGDFANSTQVHDWNPGIEPSGLFWTIPVRDDQVSVQPGSGRARFSARNLAVPDYLDFIRSVTPGTIPIPSHVSFDVRWQGGGAVSTLHDDTYEFSGRFVDGPIGIDFTTRQDGSDVVYRSNSDGQITVGGGAGRERNGVFFH
jgi:hypothetical protein